MFREIGSVLIFVTSAFGSNAVAGDTPFLQSFRLYGHFSPSVVALNDGADRYANFADNSYSPGRIGFWLETPLPRGRLRFNLETSLGLRASASINQLKTPPLINLNASTLRKLETIYDTERIGSFSFGQGSMATDGVTESDLSGTQQAAYVQVGNTGGGFFFRTGAGTLSQITISNAFPAFDGGRAPRIRWDSPDLDLSVLGTLGVAASAGLEVTDGQLVINDALVDAAVLYRNTIGQLDIKGSAGVSLVETSTGNNPQTSGSISLLHKPTGFSTTFAGGSQLDNGRFLYVKAGFKRRLFDIGDTAFSVDVYDGYDTVSQGSRSRSYGIGAAQNNERSNLQFYVGWRRYEFRDNSGISYRSAGSIIFGTRWVFRELQKVKFEKGRSEVDWSHAE